ncbi:MAG: DUF924 domain-containing protein [Novosphingobium sp.]|nr:DUF924 domain-containing protein [Rhodobiaceae bacterium]MCB2074726.1 DUF924 domain-containing protein [Novosphingobium sp.]MCP5403348.1 DUF924 domain-containing protein [Novosphingobium sp.]
MAAAYRPWAADLLHFWFNKLRPNEWFGRSSVVDAALEQRFGHALAALGGRPASGFLGDPQTARAAVLLFDQVPRNLFRDDARAFAFDPLARAITKGAIDRGWDKGLGKSERQFLYMPLMHSEAITDQRLSLRLYAGLDDSFVLGFARAHYRMIARFGRFPHRNPVLGRRSTEAEKRAVAAGNAW